VQELRVLLLRLARALVQHAQASLPAYGADFVQLLSGALQDTTPDVAIAACDCCCSLASTLQRRLGAQNAVLLAEGATLHTSSTRAAVRRAALDAVHQLVLCGAHEHLLTMCASVGAATLLVGGPGTAKTTIVAQYMGKLNPDTHTSKSIT
jgi:hypothetical protein